jgi:hypothetical protein
LKSHGGIIWLVASAFPFLTSLFPYIMPSRSFISANSYANVSYKQTEQPATEHGLRRSARLMKKARSKDLVRRILNIPIYVPKLGVASDPYDIADKTRDVEIVKTYLMRGEELHKCYGRDAILARTINAACLFIYLCENPSILKHHDRFRETVKNKRNELLGSLKYYRDTFAGDNEFIRNINVTERIFSVISVLLF